VSIVTRIFNKCQIVIISQLTIPPLINQKGGENVADVSEKVIGVGIGLVTAGILVPIGLDAIAGAEMENVDPAVATVFSVMMPILGVIAIAYAFYKG